MNESLETWPLVDVVEIFRGCADASAARFNAAMIRIS